MGIGKTVKELTSSLHSQWLLVVLLYTKYCGGNHYNALGNVGYGLHSTTQ